jgi:hypothetical protein
MNTYFSHWSDGVCKDDLLSRKHGFLISAMHSHAFPWFSCRSMVFLFPGFLLLQLNQIWQILYVMYGEEGEGDLFTFLFVHFLEGPQFKV